MKALSTFRQFFCKGVSLFIVTFMFTIGAFAQLNGTYIIGAGGDYSTIQAAADDLHNLGVSGPVVLSIAKGIYEEQVLLDYIPNSDETKTITFQSASGDSTDVVIQYGDATYDYNYVVKLKRLSYVTFKNITFKTTNETYARVVLLEDYAVHLSFTGSVFEGIYSTQNNARSLLTGTTGVDVRDIKIENNLFFRGGDGIFLNCTGKNNLRPEIISNKFDSIGYTSIFLQTVSSAKINDNLINGGTYGFNLSQIIGQSSIRRNRILNISVAGMRINALQSSTDFEAEICNNEISANQNGREGLSISNSYFFNVYNNTILVNHDYYATKALSFTNCVGSSIAVLNNNLFCEKSGYALYVESSDNFRMFDYNNFYSPGRILAYWDVNPSGTGVDCEDLNTLKAESGDNNHSLFAYPYFEKDTVLKPRSAWLDNRGKMAMGVDYDIEGTSRNNPPDIGCYEFASSDNVKPPLSGTVTIGMEYATLQDAIDDAQIKGISDSLKIQFPSGTYNMQCVIPPITGASSKHPVIIESATGSAGDVTIRYDAEGYDDNYIVKLRGSSFLQFRNLSFEALDDRYCMLFDMSGMLDSLKINSCVFTGKPINQAGTDLLTVDDDKTNFHYQEYRNNTFNLGGTSLNLYLLKSLSRPGMLVIENNKFVKSVQEAISISHVGSALISYNVLDSTGKGVQIWSSEFQINNNKISANYGSGIALNSCSGSSANPGRIFNNFVSVYNDYPNGQGIDIRYCDTVQVYFNSVYINPQGTPYGTHIYSPVRVEGGKDIDMQNNILFNSGMHYSVNVINSTFAAADYNCYYSEGDNLGYWNQDCADLDAIKAASASNDHSLFANPVYVSNIDLHTQNSALDSTGVYISEIKKDIDGENRNLQYPDIGADEFGGGIVNNSPVAINDTVEMIQGYTVNIYALKNDSDPDLDSIFIKTIGETVVGHTHISNDRSYIEYFVPDLTFAGADSFKYTIEDKFGLRDSAMIFVTVKKPVAFEQTDIELDSISHGTALWADIDTDGDMDILLAGLKGTDTEYASEVRIYSNDDNSDYFIPQDIFAEINPNNEGGAAWGDFDNDGDPDLIVTGYENFPSVVTKLFRNDDGQFTLITTEIPSVSYGSVDWGDYDNDGDLDILLTGNIGDNNNITKIYRNDGYDSDEPNFYHFHEIDIIFPGIRMGAAHWGDYDRDGDLDILISGSVLYNVWLYDNDGNGGFNEVSTGISNINGHSMWCDYNNDGYPDIVIGGSSDSDPVIKIFRNDAGGSGRTFADINAGLLGLEAGSVSCGDYDVDGDADILITGRDADNRPTTKLYENIGDDNFEEANMEFPGVVFSSGTWADYNNDDRPDILLTGYQFDPDITEPGNRFTAVFEGKAAGNNQHPATPQNLTAVIDDNSVVFSWDPASDPETPAEGLTYNVRVGTTPGGSEIMSAMANASDGQLFVPGVGNVRSNTSWTLKGFPHNTTCYWSVQAIDPSLGASAFAEEHTFEIKTVFNLGIEIYNQLEQPVNTGTLTIWYKDDEGIIDWAINREVTSFNEILNDIPQGNITLCFTPDRVMYPGSLRTYYGNKLFSKDATWFDFHHDMTGLTIMVNQLTRVTGLNTITGVFHPYIAYGSILKSLMSDAEDHAVYLFNSAGDVVKEDITANDGSFAFDSVPQGHYAFAIDLGDATMSSSNDSIIIDDDYQTIDLDVEADENDIVTYSVSGATNVRNSSRAGSISILKNPVKNNIYIKVNTAIEGTVNVKLYSIDGELIKNTLVNPPQGNSLIRIPVSDIGKGLYILNISGKHINVTTKIVKQ